MATLIYLRKGPKAYNTASSREVSVTDIIHLYGSEPLNYRYMKDVASPDLHAEKGPAKFFSDPSHVVIKIDMEEVDKEIFPKEGFYIVQEAKQ